MKKKTTRRKADPVTVELVRNSLLAATEEMKSVLMRTSYNMIIYEALDFTVGLFDRRGDTLSIGLGLPMFIRGMADTVKSKIRHCAILAFTQTTSCSPTTPTPPERTSTISRSPYPSSTRARLLPFPPAWPTGRTLAEFSMA